MIRRVLIANRGEVAVRVIRACRDLGLETVQAYSDADAKSLAVQLADASVNIGASPARESYLNPMAVIGAAILSDCDAIHPGYGFLSENAAFARQCRRNGLTFIGPTPEVIEQMGDKAVARSLAKKAGVPTVPGSEGAIADVAEARALADAMGYPVLLKAAAGGGGKGMRVVEASAAFEAAFLAAQSEAHAAFGDSRIYIERFLTDIRHVEVQLIGDGVDAIHVGERDCSIQRRHQKLVEETPSPAVDAALREALTDAALRLARAVGYTSLGTVEFVLDNPTREFYFIEMNTRLQVEHPVTEMVTGIDLVAEQIRVASGERLSLRQEDVAPRGHALECRINAENAERGFLPQPGTISALRLPAGPWVRVDTHAFAGCEVPPYYDSLVAKLVTWGATREDAIERMRRALAECRIEGVATNVSFHARVMDDPRFLQGSFSTAFIDTMPAPQERTHAS
jgi:acetyl-CoA carboxylase biotin carboxylase subunit